MQKLSGTDETEGLAERESRETASMILFPAMSTRREKLRRKSAPRMGVETGARRKLHWNRL